MYRYILERLYHQKQEKHLEHVIVVSQYDEVFEDIDLHFPGIEVVRNPAPEKGISGSVRLGMERLEQLNKLSAACLFTVADQPFLTLESLKRVERFWEDHSCGIVAAASGKRIGNPVIFGSEYYKELKCLNGDTGGKKVMYKHMEDAGFCEIPAGELMDLDTMEAVRESGKSRTETADNSALEYFFPFLKERGHVISIVGAGGKTTLMYKLAQAYARKGNRVVITTTTHMKRPENYPVAGNKEEMLRMLSEHRIVVAGADVPGGKMTMAVSMGLADYMMASDVVLIEADGAKCLPCKVPVEKEPVIPEQSDIVLGVMGLDTVGEPLGQICFRKEKAKELLQTGEQHLMTEKDMAEILSSEWGTRKGVGKREYYVVLNKCDTALRRRQGERIRELLSEKGISTVVCISLNRF